DVAAGPRSELGLAARLDALAASIDVLAENVLALADSLDGAIAARAAPSDALRTPAEAEDPAAAEDVAAEGDDDDASFDRRQQPVDAGGLTALIFAAREGDLESVKLLLEAGADVNQ